MRLTDESIRERDNLHGPHAPPVGNSIAVRQARCCPTPDAIRDRALSGKPDLRIERRVESMHMALISRVADMQR